MQESLHGVRYKRRRVRRGQTNGCDLHARGDLIQVWNPWSEIKKLKTFDQLEPLDSRGKRRRGGRREYPLLLFQVSTFPKESFLGRMGHCKGIASGNARTVVSRVMGPLYTSPFQFFLL